jgi:hypothetical protein
MKSSAILISGFVMINPRRSPAKVGFIWAPLTAVKYFGLPSPLRQPTHESLVYEVGHAARRTGGKQPTPISERYDASVPLLGGGRLFYLHWELQRTQRKGWELPHTPPLTWNALASYGGISAAWKRMIFRAWRDHEFFSSRSSYGRIFFDPEYGGTGIERKVDAWVCGCFR